MIEIDHDTVSINSGQKALISESKNPSKGTIIHLHGLPGDKFENFRSLHKLIATRGYRVISFNYPGLWNTNGKFSIQNSIQSARNIIEFSEESYAGPYFLFAESFGSFIACHVLHEMKKSYPIFHRAPLAGLEIFQSDTDRKQQLSSSIALLIQSGIIQPEDQRNADLMSIMEGLPDFITVLKELSKAAVTQYVIMGRDDEVLPSNLIIEIFKPYCQMQIYEHLSHNNISRDQWIDIITRADIFYSS